MLPDPVIRPETTEDPRAIESLISRAFHGMWYSEGDEAALVSYLRDNSALAVSLVAELDGLIVGHIAFSPAFPSDGSDGWFALGPLAVAPEAQRNGIGTLLTRAGLDALRDLGARGCVLVGHTEYYSRFGFTCFPSLCPAHEPAEHFMILELAGPLPNCPIAFHPAFHASLVSEQ